MKLIQKLILMLVLLLVGAPAALAADRMLTGNVRDAQDEPLIGVSVQVVENKAAVSTDIDGNFTIKVPAGAVTLKISYVGYKAKTVKVGADQTKVDIILEEDAMMLEETVVVGYGVQKKVNLTGSVTSVDGAKLEDRLSHSVSNMLQGSVPGLNITTNSGVPGQQSGELNIRGVTSIAAKSAPLVLIDGTIGDMDDVNPNDIASISVIKDASAAAVYGARGAFGVILVTTKSGKSDNGKAKVRFSGRWGWNEPTTSTEYETRGYWSVYTVNQFVTANGTAKEVNYTDYDMMQLLARVNDKTENPDRPWTMEIERNGKRQWIYYGNYDRYHMVFNDQRPTQQYNLSINGGTDAAKYYLSGGYNHEKGMLKVNPDIYKKYNLRAKIDFNINKWITMQNNTAFMGSTYNFVGPDANVENALAYGARHALACFPEKNPDGSWLYLNSYNSRGIMNGRHIMLAEGNHRNVRRRTEFTNMTRMDIKPIKQLTVTADFTYRFSQSRNTFRGNNITYRVTPDGPLESYKTGAGQNELTEQVYTRNYYTVNAFATYNDTFAGDHNLTVVGGYNYESYDYKNISAYAQNLTSEDLDDLELKGGEGEIRVGGGQAGYAIQGIFGRINYDYKGKYLVELSGRIDGTSRFAKGHRWSAYPSGSVGWRMSEESFFQPLRSTVDNLKIRFSYGRLGNQNIKEYYTYLRQVTSHNFAGYTFDGNTMGTYTSIQDPIASDRTWEKAEHYDLGIDASFFGTRLNITADGYIRRTVDMLAEGVALPSVYGASAPLMNVANLNTKGYEVSVNWMDNIQLGNQMLTYSVGFNLSDYRSKITKYDNPDRSFAKDYYEGMEYGEIWGFKTGGLFKTTEEAQKYASEVNLTYVAKRINGGWQAGDIKYLDVDGSGDISLGKNTVDDSGDRVKLGNKLPRLQYGFNASIRYFGFDVSAFFQGTGNHYWYPHGHSMPFWGSYSYPYLSFMPADFREKIWSEDNPNAYFPRPMAYASTSGTLQFVNDRYLQNLRYLRFKNLTVGYTLPKKWTKVAYMEKVRVYFSGENLCYWSPLKKNTKYIDPEAAFDRTGGDGVMSNMFYPWSRTFMFGIDVTF